MKRTALKKISPSERKKREVKLDRAYQDFFRGVCEEGNIPCEVCGKPMNLVHHFIEKSQCVNLRYNPLNFIPLCSGCHFKIHMVGDYTGIAKITLRRGKKWFSELQEIKKLVGHKDKATYDKAEKQLHDWQWTNLAGEGNQDKLLIERYKKLKHF